jgi:hypothetical protein
MHQRGEFLWAVEVHGLWYGTLRRVVADGLTTRAHCVLLALTPDVLPILYEGEGPRRLEDDTFGRVVYQGKELNRDMLWAKMREHTLY